MNNNSTRASSLDALRGYAILTMVLSGSVAWGVLPGWMYHAQVGPRSNFVFDGSIYFYSAYISVGSIFSPGCSLMAHCIGRFCLDVSHVHEDSVQNAGIRKDAD